MTEGEVELPGGFRVKEAYFDGTNVSYDPNPNGLRIGVVTEGDPAALFHTDNVDEAMRLMREQKWTLLMGDVDDDAMDSLPVNEWNTLRLRDRTDDTRTTDIISLDDLILSAQQTDNRKRIGELLAGEEHGVDKLVATPDRATSQASAPEAVRAAEFALMFSDEDPGLTNSLIDPIERRAQIDWRKLPASAVLVDGASPHRSSDREWHIHFAADDVAILFHRREGGEALVRGIDLNKNNGSWTFINKNDGV